MSSNKLVHNIDEGSQEGIMGSCCTNSHHSFTVDNNGNITGSHSDTHRNHTIVTNKVSGGTYTGSIYATRATGGNPKSNDTEEFVGHQSMTIGTNYTISTTAHLNTTYYITSNLSSWIHPTNGDLYVGSTRGDDQKSE